MFIFCIDGFYYEVFEKEFLSISHFLEFLHLRGIVNDYSFVYEEMF